MACEYPDTLPPLHPHDEVEAMEIVIIDIIISTIYFFTLYTVYTVLQLYFYYSFVKT